MAGNPFHRGGGSAGGRFTSAAEAGAQGAMSVKAARAKASAKIVDKTIQRYAEANEPEFARNMGGVSFKDGEPADVVIPDEHGVVRHGVELKTVVDNSNGKITMKGDALARKRSWARRNHASFHTVVIDDSKVYNAGGAGKHDYSQRQFLYRRGAGSFRLQNMYRASGYGELKSLIGMKSSALPKGAK